MIDTSPNKTLPRFLLWLPYFVGGTVFLSAVILWYLLAFSDIETAIIAALPWMILGLGAVLATLFAITIRFALLTHQRSKVLDDVKQNVKKEIGERIQVEESKQKLERTLLQGQKLQAIGTLAGGIAHDFNNILYAIVGYVEMAREDVPPDSTTYKNLGKVLEASDRGKELISRILTFSRRQRQDFQPIF